MKNVHMRLYFLGKFSKNIKSYVISCALIGACAFITLHLLPHKKLLHCVQGELRLFKKTIFGSQTCLSHKNSISKKVSILLGHSVN